MFINTNVKDNMKPISIQNFKPPQLLSLIYRYLFFEGISFPAILP